MNPKEQRIALAKTVVEIQDKGWYLNDRKQRVNIRKKMRQAKAGTRLFEPTDFPLLARQCELQLRKLNHDMYFEVTPETTLAAAYRWVVKQHRRPLCLNFASAKHPGGGFLKGAMAQEESIALASGLYRCLMTEPGYYEENRVFKSSLYTDHMILSPDVPIFRSDDNYLREPYTVSILTSPAPNATAIRSNEPQNEAKILPTLDSRIEKALSIAVVEGYDTLILGAWGCGVFGNDPTKVAQLFAKHLSGRFLSAFKDVIFAVLDKTEEFEAVFS